MIFATGRNNIWTCLLTAFIRTKNCNGSIWPKSCVVKCSYFDMIVCIYFQFFDFHSRYVFANKYRAVITQCSIFAKGDRSIIFLMTHSVTKDLSYYLTPLDEQAIACFVVNRHIAWC